MLKAKGMGFLYEWIVDFIKDIIYELYLNKVDFKIPDDIFYLGQNAEDILTWNNCYNVFLSCTEATLHIYFLSYLLILEITSKKDM